MFSLPQDSLARLFKDGRTYSTWEDKPVSESTLKTLYELVKMGPTSANCCPARLIFVSSTEAKAKLIPCLNEGNEEQTQAAPVTVILAQDMEFYEQLPKLFPHTDARSWFAGNDAAIENTASRNSSLQGGYMIMAARALGLDCGPMSGFSPKKVKEAFFPDKPWKANFLCNLGYGDKSGLYPRNPRLSFDEACEIV
jgi:3-hydroxypropanoate dehydrogenase